MSPTPGSGESNTPGSGGSSKPRSGGSRLTRDGVRRIAALARLELTESEIDLFARQLTGILEYADSLQAVDTAGVTPFDIRIGDASWRQDTPVPSLSQNDALSNAPNGDR